MAKRTSQMKELIRESMEDLRHGDFPEDPKLAEQLLSGPERFEHNQKKKDEVVIDSLLSDISGKTGYFLKLKKEVRPNEYMLMKVIETDWRKWPDIETAVCDIIKEHTKISPVKWGTGAYRIEVACKGGMRGKGYDPIDLYINAEEEFNAPQVGGVGVGNGAVVSPDVAVASKLEELRTLVDVIGGIVPKPQDPALIQTQIAQAFQQGMQTKTTESGNMSAMMSTMMTGMLGLVTAMMQNKPNEPRVVNAPEESMSKMLGVMKDFGVLQRNEPSKEKTIVDFAKELQLLGIDLFKKDDPMDQITKLKQMAGIASQFMGMGGEGEKPSILERIVDVLGPSIPKMISDIKATAENAARVQMIAGQNIRSAQIPMNGPTDAMPTPVMESVGESTTYQKMGGRVSRPTTPQDVAQPVEQTEQVKTFFAQLYESAKVNNKMFYPVIYTSLLQDQEGVQLVTGIAQNTHNAKHLIDMLQQHGGERFRDSQFVMRNLVPYVNGFIVWIQNMAGVQRDQMPTGQESVKREEFDVICGTCRTVFSYPSEAEFLTDTEKNCGEEGCTGSLEPYTKAINS